MTEKKRGRRKLTAGLDRIWPDRGSPESVDVAELGEAGGRAERGRGGRRGAGPGRPPPAATAPRRPAASSIIRCHLPFASARRSPPGPPARVSRLRPRATRPSNSGDARARGGARRRPPPPRPGQARRPSSRPGLSPPVLRLPQAPATSALSGDPRSGQIRSNPAVDFLLPRFSLSHILPLFCCIFIASHLRTRGSVLGV